MTRHYSSTTPQMPPVDEQKTETTWREISSKVSSLHDQIYLRYPLDYWQARVTSVLGTPEVTLNVFPEGFPVGYPLVDVFCREAYGKQGGYYPFFVTLLQGEDLVKFECELGRMDATCDERIRTLEQYMAGATGTPCYGCGKDRKVIWNSYSAFYDVEDLRPLAEVCETCETSEVFR